jgi:transglutaminase-like putative cysteine protease
MIYDVRQTTVHRYASTVAYAQHVLRFGLTDREGQRVHVAAIDIEPVPFERREAEDYFGNRTTWIVLDQPHDALTVRVAARVALDKAAAAQPVATRLWEEVRAEAFARADLAPMAPAHYLFASRQVSLEANIRAYAAMSFPPGRAVLDGASELMRRIKADFVYQPGATTTMTTPATAFTLRRGVCQDFAHVMISGLRGLGLPAAYVSGYLRTVPPEGQAQLAGADAMHAWVLVWCGGEIGWRGLDPTNGIFAGNEHVVLAIGRDYADVAPIDGVIFAAGAQRLEVAVSVAPVG